MNQNISEISDLYHKEQQKNTKLQQKIQQDQNEFQQYNQLVQEEQETIKNQYDTKISSMQEHFENKIKQLNQELQKTTELNKESQRKLTNTKKDQQYQHEKIDQMQKKIDDFQRNHIKKEEYQKLEKEYFKFTQDFDTLKIENVTIKQQNNDLKKQIETIKTDYESEIQDLIKQNFELQKKAEFQQDTKKNEVNVERESFLKQSFNETKQSFNSMSNFGNYDDIPDFHTQFQDNTMDYINDCENCQQLQQKHNDDYKKFLEDSQEKNAQIILLQKEILNLKEELQKKEQNKFLQDKSTESVSNFKLSRVSSRQQFDTVQENLLKKVIDIEQTNKELQSQIKYITKQQLQDTGYYKSQTQTLYSILIQNLQDK